jgi:peptide/nickel transport system permease protein
VKTGRRVRIFFAALLCLILGVGLFAGQIARHPYAKQFREAPNAAPSPLHVLGTDALGRDLFARLIYGTRVSLLLAPAAALLSTFIAAFFGATAGLVGGWCEKLILGATDLSMALPLLFVLLALRALLPLNVPPLPSVIATFVLLGLLGWPSALRVVWASARNLRSSDFVLLARASGCRRSRIVVRHLLPNLRPVLLAQFWVAIPVYILTEATLSMLGLGVMEPLPSWGNLLRGLEDFSAVSANPWSLCPLALLILVVVSFQMIVPLQEEHA